MLRELGFLNESSPEAEAQARSNSQLTTAPAAADTAADGSMGLQAAGTAGADSLRELSNTAEANSGVAAPSQQPGVVRGQLARRLMQKGDLAGMCWQSYGCHGTEALSCAQQ